MIARAAHNLGRDPLEALGLGGLPLVGEMAVVALALTEPEVGERILEEREVERFRKEMETREAWEAALPGGRGYRGPRGTAWTGR